MIPGDKVSAANLGPGIWAEPLKEPLAMIPGEYIDGPRAAYIMSNGKRYIPARNDFVVGTICQRLSDVYRVQLQPYSRPVRLDQFAFEGANKKNKPNLQVGDVVYARVAKVDPVSEAELECMDTSGKSNGFGPLNGGTLISVSLGFARHLLFKGHPILEAIGAKYTFEMAIGVNGVIWIKAQDDKLTLQISQWIKRAESVDIKEALKGVK